MGYGGRRERATYRGFHTISRIYLVHIMNNNDDLELAGKLFHEYHSASFHLILYYHISSVKQAGRTPGALSPRHCLFVNYSNSTSSELYFVISAFCRNR